MNRKVYRMIVLFVCLFALVFSMLACDGGDGCITNEDGVLVCDSYESFQDAIEPSVTDQIKQTVEQVNQTISQDTAQWVSQHSAGTMDCLSVWNQSCEDKGVYNK